MTKETADKAASLLKEITTLGEYKKLLQNKDYGNTAHFEFVQHYGRVSESERVVINDKYTQRLVMEVDKIISELETELSQLN